jgi:predicted nucleic acid-binding protein
MKLAVDANVAIKWYIDEPSSAVARWLLDRDCDLVAPEHILAEVGQVLWRRFRQGEIAETQVAEIMKYLPLYFDLVPLEEIAAEATRMACEIEYTVYDCLYVAAAQRHDTYLVTADGRFLEVLSASRYSGRAQSLQSVNI